MKKARVSEMLLAAAGIVLVGTGVAFNAAAALGNDPVGIVYDGIRNVASLSPQQLGMASNLVNVILLAGIFFTGRHYINIGTFIYIIPYGLFVDLGGKLYQILFPAPTLTAQIAGAAAGCLLLYTGVAMYITADIGLDPFTGVVMVIRDRVRSKYRVVKVLFDLGCIILGTLLGGKLGVITVITALTAGPVIQFLSDLMKQFRTGRKEEKTGR